MKPLTLPDFSRRWDCLSLGEVMLRLDPAKTAFMPRESFQVWEGGGEYNVARGLRRCFGLANGNRYGAGGITRWAGWWKT